MAFPTTIKALLFDVFGTVVDWRTTVVQGLWDESKAALTRNESSIAPEVRERANGMSMDDWRRFAQAWRNEYLRYCASRAADASLPVTTIDEHHHESLKKLLHEWQLEDLWTHDEVLNLSLIWHKLVPWSDSAAGLHTLASLYTTCTLSNGNFSLLEDLKTFGNLDFKHVFSAEEFGTFKPNKGVYLGAVQKLALQPNECALVAAHLGDLQAAKRCGLSAIYVERPNEEGWRREKVEEAKKDGWVDLWVNEGEGGFVALAQRLNT